MKQSTQNTSKRRNKLEQPSQVLALSLTGEFRRTPSEHPTWQRQSELQRTLTTEAAVRAPAAPGTRCLAPPAHATLNATRSPGSTRVGEKAWDDRLIGHGVSTYLEEPDERRR